MIKCFFCHAEITGDVEHTYNAMPVCDDCAERFYYLLDTYGHYET